MKEAIAEMNKRNIGLNSKWVALAPALLVWLLYFTTTCRAIWIGDSAEFALALKTCGVAHPPGYPLFTIIGTIAVQLLGFLRPVFAGGIYNISLAAAATGVVYLIARRFYEWLPALGISCVWGVTAIFWAETAGVEIYTLNVLLFALVVLAAFSRSRNRWLLLAYLFGLSLSNHPSALSLAPALLYFFLMERAYRKPARLIPMILLVLIAGSIYFYLWGASIKDPISDWGNPEGIAALWSHMKLEQYSGWVENSVSNLLYAAKLYYRTVIECYTIVGLLLLVAGTIAGISKRRRETIFLLIVLVAALVLAAFHQAVNYEPFFLIPMLVTLLLISFNLEWIRERQLHTRIAGAVIIAIACLLGVSQYAEQDKSDYNLYDQYSRALLDAVPGNGTLFLAGDINSFGPTYLRYAENYRPDLTLFDRSIRKRALLEQAAGLGIRTDDLYVARAAVLQLDGGRKLFAKSHYQNEPSWWEGIDSLYSYGLLYEYATPVDQHPPLPGYPPNLEPGDLMSRELVANIDLINGEEALLRLPPDSMLAEAYFEAALGRYAREFRGVLYNQLGIFFRKVGYLDLALRAYETGLEQPVLAAQTRDEIEYNISNIYKDRANRAIAARDFESAINNCKQALELDPENEQLLLNAALILERELNRPQEAIPYYERYLRLRPDDDRVRRALDALK